MSKWLLTDAAGQTRCWWCGEDPEYQAYHDQEWGRPVHEDVRLFEKLCLEGFQCGLSWLTILRKRPRFREVFHGFEIERVARMNERDVTRLLGDAGIIRHQGKIRSTIANAKAAIQIIDEHGSLSEYLWSFAPTRKGAAPRNGDRIPTQTPASVKLSKTLKKQGFGFVGPTTMYAFMQSVGMVNDHLQGCLARDECDKASP